MLVETDWLDFGHKFGDRCGHQENADDVSEQCPVFLQWLDCVHQLLKQFPCLFEFNEALLVGGRAPPSIPPNSSSHFLLHVSSASCSVCDVLQAIESNNEKTCNNYFGNVLNSCYLDCVSLGRKDKK